MTPTPNRTCVSTKSQNALPTRDPQNSNKEKPDAYNKIDTQQRKLPQKHTPNQQLSKVYWNGVYLTQIKLCNCPKKLYCIAYCLK
jgi:hypothetical protein